MVVLFLLPFSFRDAERASKVLTTLFFSNLSQTSKKYLAKSSSEIGLPLILIRSRTATR